MGLPHSCHVCLSFALELSPISLHVTTPSPHHAMSHACREIAVLAALADQADDEDGEGAAAAHGGKHTGPVPAAASGLVVYSMDAKGKSTRARGGKGSAAAGRASTGGGGGRGTRGRGTGRTTGSKATGKKTKSRRRRFKIADDSSEEDAGADSGDEEWDGAKPGKARKLFE